MEAPSAKRARHQQDAPQLPVRCSLEDDQIRRYSRHLLLPAVGVTGQQHICNASVLVVGAGGLGSTVCLYLAGAGVGKLGIVDGDDVETSNLHRQIIHRAENVGMNKAKSARASCLSLNPLVECKAYCTRLESSNSLAIFSDGAKEGKADSTKNYQVVVDCSDNIPTRFLINDSAVLSGCILVSGSAVLTEGQLSVYNYRGGPCYRCVYPDPPNPLSVTSCSDGGVLGVIPGLIGCMQALEVLKIIVNGHEETGETESFDILSRRLLVFDGPSSRSRIIRMQEKRADCEVCGKEPRINAAQLLSNQRDHYTQMCIDHTLLPGGERTKSIENKSEELVSVDQLAAACFGMRNDENEQREKERTIILDVRSKEQFAICSLPNSSNMPYTSVLNDKDSSRRQLSDLVDAASGGIDCEKHQINVYIVCKRGLLSRAAVGLLKTLWQESISQQVRPAVQEQDKRPLVRFLTVVGGLEAWSRTIDSRLPLY